jgi:hypothetical protein
MTGVEVFGTKAAELLSPKAGIISESQHNSVSDWLASGDGQQSAPLFLVRNPGQAGLTRNQPAAIADLSQTACIATTANRICLAKAVLNQIVII